MTRLSSDSWARSCSNRTTSGRRALCPPHESWPCGQCRNRRRNAVKFILILAAVLVGDPASTDPSLEVAAKLFDTQTDCEQAKAGSTGEGKGEIEGKQVLRIVGRCQELSPVDVQRLRDALQP